MQALKRITAAAALIFCILSAVLPSLASLSSFADESGIQASDKIGVDSDAENEEKQYTPLKKVIKAYAGRYAEGAENLLHPVKKSFR